MKKILQFICVAVFFWLLTSCSNIALAVDKRECPIDQLLLDQSSYPPDTILDEIYSPIAEEPRESASRSIYFHENWIGEIIIRYPSIKRAEEVYKKRTKSVFHPSEVNGLWEFPSEISLDDLSANQHEIACGNVKNFGERCIMISRYQEYFVMFNVDISNDEITRELFRDLVLKIDDRMSACVNQ